MSVQVTLTLPDELYETATRWAALTRHDLTDTLTDALYVALSPRNILPAQDKPLSALSDAEVIALCGTDANAEPARRVNELLEKQREGALKSREQQELVALMQEYDRLWLRQSEALAEAVRRGLHASLEP
jgi:hypothetical protein